MLPCPFCGNIYLRMSVRADAVFCSQCETEGPAGSCEEDAVAKWNTRLTQTESTPCLPHPTELSGPTRPSQPWMAEQPSHP